MSGLVLSSAILIRVFPSTKLDSANLVKFGFSPSRTHESTLKDGVAAGNKRPSPDEAVSLAEFFNTLQSLLPQEKSMCIFFFLKRMRPSLG
jgi:hypothetical protein